MSLVLDAAIPRTTRIIPEVCNRPFRETTQEVRNRKLGCVPGRYWKPRPPLRELQSAPGIGIARKS